MGQGFSTLAPTPYQRKAYIMDDRNIEVNYIVFESTLARMERINKRLFILCSVLFLAFMVSNMAWLCYESKFEDTVITAEQDGEGINIVGGGDVDYGAEGDH